MHYKEFTYFSFSTVNNCRCGWKDIFFSVVTNVLEPWQWQSISKKWLVLHSGKRNDTHHLPRGPWACGSAGICQAANKAPPWGPGSHGTSSPAAAGQPSVLGKPNGPTWQQSLFLQPFCWKKERKTHKRFPKHLKTITGGMTIPSCNV